jgi:hypothetical protein
VVVGKNCVLKSNTRLLSGAQMSDFSIMQEHTLVLAGDTVDSGSAWQGWPSHQITPLEIYRKYVIHLVNRAVFKSTSTEDNSSHAKRQRDRNEMHYEMMEESKGTVLGDDIMRSSSRQNGKPRHAGIAEESSFIARLQQQKRVSFKTNSSSPAKELASEKDALETTPLLKK